MGQNDLLSDRVSMKEVIVIDRKTGKKEKEKIMGHSMIMFLYGSSFLSKCLAPSLRFLFCHCHFVSNLYGFYQKTKFSKKNIIPFIDNYKVDQKEFEDPISSFASFNDFFIRKLKKKSRPIDPAAHHAVCPADGRYLCFQNLNQIKNFWIKGKKFQLSTFLNDSSLEKLFKEGSMVIARLCPSDYHRYHFPVSGIAGDTKLINGALFSVNPIALYKNFLILQENKRSITLIESEHFGTVAYIEIGATNVGSIHQTFKPHSNVFKGDEKGYFSFGGSCVVILFQKGKVELDHDLCENTLKGFETKCLMGQSLGSTLD
jgi:phosphatidylserine decarboxylase